MPAVARGDGKDSVKTNHGCDGTTVTDQCSSDVFVNGVGVVRLGDNNRIHLRKVGDNCVPHTVALSKASGTVFANGKGIGRKGDKYGREEITSGSANVFAG